MIFFYQSIAYSKKSCTFASHLRKTTSKCLPVPWMSGLVSGLQNRVRRFESARNLHLLNNDATVPWMSGLVSGLQNRVRRFESARNLKHNIMHS